MAYDADIDALMTRTATRPIPHGPYRARRGAGFRLDAVGRRRSTVMGLFVNCAGGGAAGLHRSSSMSCVYTLWLKRRTPQNIVIGGLAGALPPAIGWAAVTGIAVAWRRCCWSPSSSCGRRRISGRCRCGAREDYARAGVPMLPVVRGQARHAPPDPRLYAAAGAARHAAGLHRPGRPALSGRVGAASASGCCWKPSPSCARRDEVQRARRHSACSAFRCSICSCCSPR